MIFPTRNVQPQRLTAPALPSWVVSLLHPNDASSSKVTARGDDWTLNTNGPWTVATISASDSRPFNVERFQQMVRDTYLRLLGVVRDHSDHRPVRFWNYVPGILANAESTRDRYMVFNRGRHEAFTQQYGADRINRSLVAASAVDHRDVDFQLHLLACGATFRGAENPRQRPAFRYSPRYGPVPPSFARVTIIDPASPGDPQRMITAGTASVRGEESRHGNDLLMQVEETLINLAALVADAATPQSDADLIRIEKDAGMRRDILAACRHVRAYVTHARDEVAILQAIEETFVNAASIELMPATLCRGELLVELEVYAEIETASAPRNGANR